MYTLSMLERKKKLPLTSYIIYENIYEITVSVIFDIVFFFRCLSIKNNRGETYNFYLQQNVYQNQRIILYDPIH